MAAYSSSPGGRKSLPAPGQGDIQRITIRQAPSIHDLTKRGIFGDVERILTNNPTLISEVDAFGQTPLHIAAYEGYMDLVQLLVQLGSSLSVTDKNGWTPLHCASSNRHLSIVEKIIGSGADLNAMVRPLYELPISYSSYTLQIAPLEIHLLVTHVLTPILYHNTARCSQYRTQVAQLRCIIW